MTGAGPGPGADAALVREVAAGSHDALAALYDRHADAVFASASRLTSDRGMAEEVVQETFLALWNRAETFDPSVGSLAAWLHTIARNRTVDRLRAAGRRPNLVPLSSAASSGRRSAVATKPTPTPSSGCWRAACVVAGAGATAVAGARSSPCASCGRRSRRPSPRCPRSSGWSSSWPTARTCRRSEIAERLGWPLGTVKTRTRRALLRLREVLGSGVGPEFTRYLAPAELAGPDR